MTRPPKKVAKRRRARIKYGLFVLALGLLSPLFNKKMAKAAPIAALIIALEMVLFSAVHIMSGHASETGPMIYWGVVAIVCLFVAYGRTKLKSV